VQCFAGYSQSNGLCAYCGSSTDQRTTLIGTLLVALAALVVLSIGITMLHTSTLASCVHFFCGAQLVSLVSLQGVKDVVHVGPAVMAVLVDINLVNFDVEILKPGCAGH
jgi:hypothetical protein